MLIDNLVVGMATVLTASVRVNDYPFSKLFVLYSHIVCTTDQISGQAFIDSIAQILVSTKNHCEEVNLI